MSTTELRKDVVETEHFTFLNPVAPLIQVCLKPAAITPLEFERIARLAAGYPHDARLIEMVRKAGDASAKVPYLLDANQTPASILATLREVAQPFVEHLHSMPEPLKSTIYLLLSINTVPQGCEDYAITALLALDWIQEQMLQVLQSLMSGRKLAADFYDDNVAALQQLDRDWPRLRSERASTWHSYPLPEQPQMQYHPLFDHHDHLIGLQETCIIVDSPDARMLRRLTPPVLQRPLPPGVEVPATGSVDWLIRDVGKVGRHFTRALLSIIKAHLREEKIALEAANYETIQREALEALRDYVSKAP